MWSSFPVVFVPASHRIDVQERHTKPIGQLLQVTPVPVDYIHRQRIRTALIPQKPRKSNVFDSGEAFLKCDFDSNRVRRIGVLAAPVDNRTGDTDSRRRRRCPKLRSRIATNRSVSFRCIYNTDWRRRIVLSEFIGKRKAHARKEAGSASTYFPRNVVCVQTDSVS